MDIISNSVILVVDDVPQNLEVLGTLLRGRGFKVAFASDGEQAIKSATAKVPDLILLDVSMPGMDGFEVCRILKETPETFHIPVIFLTAKSETEEVVKGFDCGGVDYIIKPFKPAELISRVTTHLELKKSREDIALRKVVEQKLKAAKEKAEELSRLKSSLLNNMSHEFRTPLISIIGYSQMMFDEIEDSEQKKMLLNIYKAGQRLLTTLNSVLCLSEIEADKLTPSLNICDLREMIGPIAEVFEEALNEKKLSLKVNMPDYSVPVNIDKVFFDQILIYLLENSIKYTNEGGIVIDVKLEKDENSTDEKAIISISDTGIGIDNKKHKMIFEEFRQASEGLSREYEGTGLGLTIAQKLASMLNGRISIKSEIGKGATFFLEFPGAEHVIFDN